jgi:hypothetical protein
MRHEYSSTQQHHLLLTRCRTNLCWLYQASAPCGYLARGQLRRSQTPSQQTSPPKVLSTALHLPIAILADRAMGMRCFLTYHAVFLSGGYLQVVSRNG